MFLDFVVNEELSFFLSLGLLSPWYCLPFWPQGFQFIFCTHFPVHYSSRMVVGAIYAFPVESDTLCLCAGLFQVDFALCPDWLKTVVNQCLLCSTECIQLKDDLCFHSIITGFSFFKGFNFEN